ncbi:ImuA family protein [Salipiger aestuarii]|uniref:ImuA family protein n=2 Tax=Salipiger aestuarii TaxID=568098 RepID=UPI0028803160|nr:hypothetical protein [Salipiger aestuarii]
MLTGFHRGGFFPHDSGLISGLGPEESQAHAVQQAVRHAAVDAGNGVPGLPRRCDGTAEDVGVSGGGVCTRQRQAVDGAATGAAVSRSDTGEKPEGAGQFQNPFPVLPCMLTAMTDFDSHFPPKNARTHEVCGPSALSFALALAGQLGGTAVWLREAWQGDQINPVGFAPYVDPQQLLLALAPSHLDLLASAEEALRSGSVTLVVMEITKPVGLTEGRRLQLASQHGNAMGLCILPQGMGSNAAQTRWRCSPVFDPDPNADSTLQNWEIIKNKSGTHAAWTVKWNAQTHRINVVSKTAQR